MPVLLCTNSDRVVKGEIFDIHAPVAKASIITAMRVETTGKPIGERRPLKTRLIDILDLTHLYYRYNTLHVSSVYGRHFHNPDPSP